MRGPDGRTAEKYAILDPIPDAQQHAVADSLADQKQYALTDAFEYAIWNSKSDSLIHQESDAQYDSDQDSLPNSQCHSKPDRITDAIWDTVANTIRDAERHAVGHSVTATNRLVESLVAHAHGGGDSLWDAGGCLPGQYRDRTGPLGSHRTEQRLHLRLHIRGVRGCPVLERGLGGPRVVLGESISRYQGAAVAVHGQHLGQPHVGHDGLSGRDIPAIIPILPVRRCRALLQWERQGPDHPYVSRESGPRTAPEQVLHRGGRSLTHSLTDPVFNPQRYSQRDTKPDAQRNSLWYAECYPKYHADKNALANPECDAVKYAQPDSQCDAKHHAHKDSEPDPKWHAIRYAQPDTVRDSIGNAKFHSVYHADEDAKQYAVRYALGDPVRDTVNNSDTNTKRDAQCHPIHYAITNTVSNAKRDPILLWSGSGAHGISLDRIHMDSRHVVSLRWSQLGVRKPEALDRCRMGIGDRHGV